MTEPAPEQPKPKVGKPLKFKTVKELQAKIDAYFAECDSEADTRKYAHEAIVQNDAGQAVCMNCGLPGWRRGCITVSGQLKAKTPYTITGLALSLGITRQTLLEYEGEVEGREKQDPEYADTVKNAKLRVENYMEHHGLYGDMAPAKAIFGLSNYGWKNPQHVDLTSKGDKVQSGVIILPPLNADSVAAEHRPADGSPPQD